MKKTVKLFIISIIIALCFPITAFADSQDGLSVTINSEKTEYTSSETAKITVAIENANLFEVKNVSVEHIVPDALKQIGLTSFKETISLSANEKVVLDAKTIKTNSPAADTGDKSNVLLFALIFIISAGALFALIKYRKKSGVLSLFLCFLLVSMLPINTFATASVNIKSFETVKAIAVNGKNYDYKVVLSYQLSPEPSVSETTKTITIDFTDSENSDCFDGLTPKTLALTVESNGGTKSYNFSGFYLSEVLAGIGVTSFTKLEAVTSDIGTFDITDFYNRDGDIMLAYGEGNPIKNEKPIRICPKNAKTGNELYKNVNKIVITS